MKPLVVLALLGLVLSPNPIRAESVTFTLTIAAEKQERVHVPVRVLIDVPGTLATGSSVVVRDASGKTLPGQLTAPGLTAQPDAMKPKGTLRELHFILPRLGAGETATFQATVTTDKTPGPSAGHFAWHDTKGEHAELRFGDRPVLRYMYKALDESSKEKREQTFKVFHHLFDPDGTRLVTKGPGGLYTHHRGLFYGFNRITYGGGKKADIWHCTGNVYQSHEKFLLQEAGPVLGRHLVEIAWHGQDKEVFAVEHRELTVYNVPGGQLVEFASRLTSKAGKVKLDGDPQHAGFHFRAANEVADQTKNLTYFLRPDGKGKPGETRNWEPKTRKGPVNLPWNAMSFVLGNQRYTAVYLDRPTNPKEARFSERDYGRFGSYFEYDLDTNKPLDVNYRVWLQKGEMTGTQAAAASANFVTPPVVTVK